MKNGTIVTLDKTRQVLLGMRALAAQKVMVGVPADKDGRKQDADEYQPINNAALAYIHNNGAPEANIPARPYLVPGIKKSKPSWLKKLADAAKQGVGGNPGGVERNLNAAGLIAQNAARAAITEGVPPPLAASTLARRRAKGRSGTTPLINTGQLIKANTYVIRKK